MSFVTLGDRAKALQLMHGETAPLSRRDHLLFSLARKTTWTEPQRALVEQMWNERRQSGNQKDQTNRAATR